MVGIRNWQEFIHTFFKNHAFIVFFYHNHALVFLLMNVYHIPDTLLSAKRYKRNA